MPEEVCLAPAGQVQGVQLEGAQHVPERQSLIENGQLAKENGPTMVGRDSGRVSDPDWIRIQSGQWIRIRIRNPDPGGKK